MLVTSLSISLLMAVGPAAPASASRHFELVELADGVYAAVHAPGGDAIANAGVVDLGGATLVFDTFHSLEAARDLRRIVSERLPSPVRYVANSHYHADHVWGNQVFADAVLVGTEQTRQAILDGAPGDVDSALEDARARLAELEDALEAEQDPHARAEAALSAAWTRAQVRSLPELRVTAPSLTLARELVLRGTRRCARLVSLGSGSTSSDVFLHLPEDGILFTGDLVMHGMNPILWEGPPENWLATLEHLRGLKAETVVPGHGDPGDGSRITTMIRYIEQVESAAREASSGAAEVGAPPAPFGAWFYPGLFAANVKRATERLGSLPASSSQPQVGATEAIQGLLSAERASVEAANDRDAERLTALYATDAILIVPNVPPKVGRDSIRQWIDGFVANPSVRFSYESLKAELSEDGTLGLVVSRYQLELTRPDGTPYREHGSWTQTWRHRPEGGWELVLETASPELETASSEESAASSSS
jgi:glyoxylase-like metal-dependent hydrolase (beta-lactamase superfamily II)/ketosteroid isomerase-like protein